MSKSELEDLEEIEEDSEELPFEEPTYLKVEDVSFNLKLENSKIFRAIVETLSSLIDETEITVSSEELMITAMDPSRICLLKLSINHHDFDQFEYSGKGRTKIGLNLDDLEKIMKRASNNDSIELTHKAEDNKIKIVMRREGFERARTFSLAMLDIDIEEVPMDNLKAISYPSNFIIDPDFFIEALQDAEIYSEILNIRGHPETGLEFNSIGQIGEMVYEIALEDLIDANIDINVSGAYSLTFLRAIMKITSILEKMTISLKTDHPLKFEMDLLQGGRLLYFLAPRVEEADFDDEELEEF